ncbi:carbonic anhydrase [Kocuria coralli]|uniref:carbonic anhydrase n=1 Tax=Kocuria coralli TaxID=1461025 RepID=A0A5J5KY60_9MICC|nr:carbonic anhydrase [Kocuria coralli]KAA9394609.1 carbonic anhydrase [Kocuria coralli]
MNAEIRPSEPQNLSPQEAWEKLREGNARFVQNGAEHPNQDASRRQALAAAQHPFTTIFGCSDSRLAAEIIFDLGLGDAFVVRTAGQVVADAVLGTLEYSVEALNVPLIVILGHDSCGAVTATKGAVESGKLPRGFQRSLVERITPAVLEGQRTGSTTVNDMVVENVRLVAERILDQSQCIAAAVERGELAIVGLFYNLSDGKAELIYQHGDALAQG